ncbi:MAG: carbonic anhydrase [Leptospirales bacterium]|nr:carbonic anhydrase [Leptospirales bacterium]
MAESYERLLLNNREWSERKLQDDPEFFARLSRVQRPDFLWIGCSDSRVPPNEITGTTPGEIFVHRNVANMVVHTDVNLLSVLQFAIEVLEVQHIIVCGHYGCGGVDFAMGQQDLGLVNTWLRNIKEVYNLHRAELEAISDPVQRSRRMVELNVIEQARNVAKTAAVQHAWRKRALAVHGWVYGLEDGRIIDLQSTLESPEDLAPVFRLAPGRDDEL